MTFAPLFGMFCTTPFFSMCPRLLPSLPNGSTSTGSYVSSALNQYEGYDASSPCSPVVTPLPTLMTWATYLWLNLGIKLRSLFWKAGATLTTASGCSIFTSGTLRRGKKFEGGGIRVYPQYHLCFLPINFEV